MRIRSPHLSVGRLKALWKKEMVQWIREPLLLLIFFLAVTVQLILFGYSANSQTSGFRLALLDQDQSSWSRGLAQSLESGGTFRVTPVGREAEIAMALRKGDVQLALVIPESLFQRLGQKESPPLKIYLDGSQASIVAAAKGQIFNRLNHYIQSLEESRPSGKRDLDLKTNVPQIQARYEIQYNSELKDSFFMVPGMIGAILMLLITGISAASFTREKETGTLASVQMSPIHPLEFVLGKSVPLFFLSLLFTILGFAVGGLWFKIPITGNILLLLIGSFSFIIFCIGLGFFTACFSKTQLQAILTTLFFTVPGIFLSGAMGQTDVWWPNILKTFSWFNPLFYYVKLSRGVLLGHMGWQAGWLWVLPLLVAMCGMTFASIALAARFFSNSYSPKSPLTIFKHS